MTIRFKKQLPPNCTIDRGKYVVWRKQVKGKSLRFPMGMVSDGIEKIWEQYHALMQARDNKPKPNTLRWLAGKYLKSRAFKNLTIHAQRGHERGSKILYHKMTEPENLGLVRLKYVTKPLINQIAERRLHALNEKGMKGTGVVNLETNFLKTMLLWGCQYVDGLEIINSPLIGMPALKVESRKRVVSDHEYQVQYNMAPPLMQCIFEIAYLCACRSVEIRNLKDSDISDDKIFLNRRKGSTSNYIELSPRLREAITKAKSLRKSKKIRTLGEDRWLFTNAMGEKMKQGTLTGGMTRLKNKMKKAGFGDIYWTLHMLKHKGMTDAEDKDVAGLSESTKKIYDHSNPTNKPVR